MLGARNGHSPEGLIHKDEWKTLDAAETRLKAAEQTLANRKDGDTKTAAAVEEAQRRVKELTDGVRPELMSTKEQEALYEAQTTLANAKQKAKDQRNKASGEVIQARQRVHKLKVDLRHEALERLLPTRLQNVNGKFREVDA